jgi:2'-5' RNA ligase
VAPHEPLKTLHHKVDQAVTRAGVPPERRAFAPHITLARLKRDAGPIDGLLAHSGGLSSSLFAVDAFALYESELTPDGAIYSIVERFDLA